MLASNLCRDLKGAVIHTGNTTRCGKKLLQKITCLIKKESITTLVNVSNAIRETN